MVQIPDLKMRRFVRPTCPECAGVVFHMYQTVPVRERLEYVEKYNAYLSTAESEELGQERIVTELRCATCNKRVDNDYLEGWLG